MLGRRRAVAVGLTAVALLAVAACDNGDDGGDADTSTTAAGDREVPVVGGTLRLGVSTIASLDPAEVSPDSPSSSIAADLLFDGLTTVAPGAAEATPGLASEWTSTDAITWRFSIDPAARFGDGTAVTAADVEFSLERVIAKGTASLVASRLDAVAAIDVVDPATVQIVLNRPLAWLPELLSAPAYGIVSRAGAAADGAAFAEGPTVSSGPFRLAERDGATLALVRAPDGEALVDRIELHQHDDLAAAFDAFEDGDLDWTLLPPSLVDTAAERYGTDGFVPFQAEVFFGFNLNDPTFADVRFRQAIVQAVDRVSLVNAVYFGFTEPLAGVIPAGVPGADPTRCGEGCRYDQEASRALLATVFPDGVVPEVLLDFADGATEAALAGAIEQDLEAVGIPVTLRPHPPAEYGAFALSGSAAFLRQGWVGVHASPEDYVERLFRSASSDNLTGLADQNVDALLGQAAATLDAAARLELIGQAEAAVLDLAAILPIAQFEVLAVAHDDVRDLDISVTGTFDSEAVWLAN